MTGSLILSHFSGESGASTGLDSRLDVSDIDITDELHHIFCCDENLALCGTDLSTTPFSDGVGEPLCVVCEDLDESDSPCPGCKP